MSHELVFDIGYTSLGADKDRSRTSGSRLGRLRAGLFGGSVEPFAATEEKYRNRVLRGFWNSCVCGLRGSTQHPGLEIPAVNRTGLPGERVM